MATYTIGALAKAAGVPTTTLRYYERLGILRPERHTKGDYRRYGPRSLERLRFIRSAAATGLTLADAAELLRAADGDESPCEPVRDRLLARFKAVTRQLHDLRKVQRKLKAALRNCCVADDLGLCGEALSLRGQELDPKILSTFRLTLHPGEAAKVCSDGHDPGARRPGAAGRRQLKRKGSERV